MMTRRNRVLNTPYSRFGRRAFLKAASALGAVPFLLRGHGASAAGEVLYFTWEQYSHEPFYAAYAEQHGGPPNYAIWADADEGLTKILGGFGPDLAHTGTYDIPKWHAADVLRPIDTSRVEAWDDILGYLKNVDTARPEGEFWHVPFDWGHSSILYRADMVEAPEESWMMLFDPQYKGRIAFYDFHGEAVPTAALALGFDNPYTLSDEQLAEVKDLLARQNELVRFYWTSPADIEQALASGEIVATNAWTESLMQLRREGLPVQFAAPKEGTITWAGGIALTNRGEGSDQAAYDLINAMLKPEAGKYLIETFGYGHANVKSFDAVDPELIALLGLDDVEGFLASGTMFDAMSPEIDKKYLEVFQAAKLGT